jgi:hypothetical protein
VHLATATNSSANAQIFNAATDTFLLVGNLNTKRESAAVVVLPNGLTMLVGGESCSAKTISGVAGFQCDALQTAELYSESTQTFTVAGAGSGGLMTIARSGPSATLIKGSGTALDGQVLIVGGSTGSSFLGASSPPAAPTGQVSLNSAEIYNPATDTFTATNSIPGCASGVASCANGLPSVCSTSNSPISSSSESGTTITFTMATANPTGLTVGKNVSIANVACSLCVTPNGYNGTFNVTAIPSSTTFQVVGPSGLGAGSGGAAGADVFECGMVDQGAALIPGSGKVLLAAGDLVTFLGQSSNLSFIFDPATATFSRTTGMLTQARELFPLVAMDPAVVTGALSGKLVAFGGIVANSSSCAPGTASTELVASTTNTAEVFDPATQLWSATANTMGVKRATVATLFETGSLAGEVILPGGVDVEAGTLPSTCTTTLSLKQAAQSETDLYAPDTGTGGTFTATGSLNQAREGQGQGVIGGASADVTDLIAIGGACTTATPSLSSVVIGSSMAATTCGNTNGTGAGCSATNSAQNDYSELYSQSAKTWSCGPTFATGFSPSNAAASTVLP